MKEVKEIKVNVPEGQLISAEVKDGVCTLCIEVAEEMIPEVVSSIQEEDDIFVCIKASELSFDDEFMKHKPKTKREKEFKDLLEEVIKKGIADFWRPRMDPTLDKAGNICFRAGKEPAISNSYNWWRDNAKKFNPKRKSRLGTKSQYIAFLGVLMKALVDEGWTVSEAWDSVCNDSKKLGHYRNSEKAKRKVEPTGSREIVGFYDLANTCKLLAEDEEAGGFWLASGSYLGDSIGNSLVDLGYGYDCDGGLNRGVGWLVLS